MECTAVARRPCQRENLAHRWHHRHHLNHHHHHHRPRHLHQPNQLPWHRMMVVKPSMQLCTQENAAPGPFVKIFVMTRKKVNPIKIIMKLTITLHRINRSIAKRMLWKYHLQHHHQQNKTQTYIFLQIKKLKNENDVEILNAKNIPNSGHPYQCRWFQNQVEVFSPVQKPLRLKWGMRLVHLLLVFCYIIIRWLFGWTESPQFSPLCKAIASATNDISRSRSSEGAV